MAESKASQGIELAHGQQELEKIKINLKNIEYQNGIVSKMSTEELKKGAFMRPLTPSEERFVILTQKYPNTGAFHERYGFVIEGELSIPILQQSICHVCNCHEILRSYVMKSSTMMCVLPHVEISLPVENVGTTEKVLWDKTIEEVQMPFNIYKPPLFRVKLFKIQEHKWLLVVTMHHIISDGNPSFAIFAKEVSTSYEAILKGNFSDLPVQVPWSRLETNSMDADLSFWAENLKGITGIVNLPWQQNPLKNLTFKADHVTKVIPPEVTRELMGLLHKTGIEQLQVLLLSVFHILLHKYSGQSDICVGYPIDNRSESNKNVNAIGYFGNPLVIRTRFRSELTSLELLKEVNNFLNAAIQHNCPFQNVVEFINPDWNKNARTPLFNTLFVFGQAPAPIHLETISIHPTHIDLGLVPYDVILTARLAPDNSLLCQLEYNSVLLHHSVMDDFLGCFASLCKSVVKSPTSPITSLSLLQEEESFQRILTLNSDVHQEYPRDKLVHEIFQEVVAKFPNSIAVHEACEVGTTLTYKELDLASDKIASLFLKNVKSSGSVVLLMERSALTVVSILGILKACCCYVPLDPYFTPQHIKRCCMQCNVTHILCSRQHADRVATLDLDSYIEVHIIDNSIFSSVIPAIAKRTPKCDDSTKYNPGNVIAYTMVTSGTTGQPKAVDVPHRAIVHISCDTNYIQFTSSDISLLHSPLNFDASTFELWSVLLNGGRLEISTEEKLSPAELAQQIHSNGVTMVWLTSGLFNVMMDLHSSMFCNVNHVLTGGDVVCVEKVQMAQCRLPLCSFYNMYGPTECTTFTSYYKTPKNFHKALVAQVPIGKPVSNTRMYILDENLMAVPLGTNGMLYIGGDGVARGYRNEPNHSAFIKPPSHILSVFPEECRLYNSGDMVRTLPDALDNDALVVHFIGRSDQQVKVNGIRLELIEIEDCLLHHPAIQRVSVVAEHEMRADEKLLVAYIVLNQDVNMTDLQTYMKQQLPSYMIPSKFITMDDILLTANGKINKTKLQTMKSASQFQIFYSSSKRKPEKEEERSMAKIWSCVLHIPEEEITMDTNFFENGGHSLIAQRMVSMVSTNLGVDIGMATIYSHPVFEDFVKAVLVETEDYNERNLLPDKYGGVSFQQHEFTLLESIGRYSPAFNVFTALELCEDVDVQAFEIALNKVVQKHPILHSLFRDKNGTTEIVKLPLLCRVRVSKVTMKEKASFEDAHPLIEEYIQDAFDYNRGPLFRCRLYQFQYMTVIVAVFHHVIADDISAWLVMQQAIAHYNRNEHELEDTNPEAYDLYIAKQKARKSTLKYREDVQYWEAKLANLIPLPDFELHGDAVPLGKRASIPISIPANLVTQICTQQNTSAVEITLAAFYLAICYKTKSNDVYITSPFACRDDTMTQSLIGPTAHRVVLHLSMPHAETRNPKVVLELVRQELAKTLLHQDYPLNVKYPLVGFSFVSLADEVLPKKGCPLVIPYSSIPGDMLMFLDVKATSNEIKGFLHYDQGYLQYSYMLDLVDSLYESIASLSGTEHRYDALRDPNNKVISSLGPPRPRRVFYNGSIVDLNAIENRICADNSVRECHVTVTEENSHPKFYIYVQTMHNRILMDKHVVRLAQTILPPDATVTQVLHLPRDEVGCLDKDKLSEIPVLDTTLLADLQKVASSCYPGTHISVQKMRIREQYPKTTPTLTSSVVSENAGKTELQVHGNTMPKNDKASTESKETDATKEKVPEPVSIFEKEIPLTMVEALQKTALRYPNKGITFIEDDADPMFMSYAKLYQLSLQYLLAITSHGLDKGHFVILLISKPRKLIPVWWGCILGGIVPTIVAKSSSYGELSGTTEKLYHVWKTLGHATIFTDANPESIRELHKFYADFQNAHIYSLNTMLGKSLTDDIPVTPNQPSPNDLLFLQLSSGSTGAPKCIQELHNKVISHIVLSSKANGYSSSDKSLNWIPMDHVVPILTFHLKDTFLGCSQHMVETSLVLSDPLNWMKLMTQYKVTHTWAPNFGFNLAAKALADVDKHVIDLSTVKSMLNAGEMVTPGTIRSFLKAAVPFGLKANAVQPSFGMAETATCFTYHRNVDLESTAWIHGYQGYEFVSLGPSMQGVDIRVVDKHGCKLPNGEIGELQIRGDVVTPGYLYNEKANKALFSDGWMCSGDHAFIVNNDLFITGRIKEQIVIRGEKYFCHEIEEKVNQVRGVAPTSSAVCGVENETTGTEELVVFFCSDDSNLHKWNISSTIRSIQVTVNKYFGILPANVVVLKKNQFQKTTSGKIQRVAMKLKYTKGEYTNNVMSSKEQGTTLLDISTHTLVWRPATLRSSTREEKKVCIILHVVGSKLADLFQIKFGNKHCTVIKVTHTGESLILTEASSGVIHTISRTASKKSYEEVFHKLKEVCGGTDIVINSISYDSPNEKGNYDSPWLEGQNQQLLFLLQSIEALQTPPQKVINVTKHSAFVTHSDIVHPSRSLSSSLVEVVNEELEMCHIFQVDLPGSEVVDSSELDKLSESVAKEALEFHKETQVAYRSLQRYIPQLNKVSIAENANDCHKPIKLIEKGVYIISGGLGGIGCILALYLHKHLEAKLIIIGRTPQADHKLQSNLTALREEAVDFVYIEGDIAMKETYRHILSVCNNHPICGAFHLATAYEEKLIKELRIEDLDAAMSAKVKGAVLLHDFLQQNSQNAILVLFSSIYSTLAVKRLASYSAANRFLETLQQHCSNDQNAIQGHKAAHCNVQTVCISWPVWRNTGLSNNTHGINEVAESYGVNTLDPAVALQLMEPLLQQKTTTIVGLRTDGPLASQYISYNEANELGVTLDQCVITISAEPSISSRFSQEILTARLEREELKDIFGNYLNLSKVNIRFSSKHMQQIQQHADTNVSECIKKHWKQVLGMPEHKDLPSENFYELGGESLHILQLASRLSKAFKLNLSTSDILEHPTISSLSAAVSALTTTEQLEHTKPEPVSSFQSNWHLIHKSQNMDVLLFCLPYIGAPPQLFQDWAFPGVGIWSALYPQEPCNMQDLVSVLAESIVKITQKEGLPFVILGHSFGSLLAIEICQYLSNHSMASPSLLIACSMYSPLKLPEILSNHQHLSSIPDDHTFLMKLKEDWGFETNPDMMMMVPEVKPAIDQVRYLYRLFEHYECQPNFKIHCPIEVIGGTEEPHITPKDLQEWHECTSNTIHVTLFPGDHFFIARSGRRVFAKIVNILMHIV